MQQSCWQIGPDRGFLISPDPIIDLSQADGLDALVSRNTVAHISQLAANLPHLLESHTVRSELAALPIYDMAELREYPRFEVIERFMQIYSYFASAYVHATDEEVAHHIPAGVAKPLYQLSEMVERPPILSYTSYVLSNWQRAGAGAGLDVDDLRLVQEFLGNRDESWFILIHVDIEARAADALRGIQEAVSAIQRGDARRLEIALETVSASLSQMITTFERMPEQCSSDTYYFRVRPYIFGFTDVIYEGVDVFNGAPQSFRGQTGAQSSIVPSLVAAFGLQHEQTGLTQHLDIMRGYMPKPHREFIAQMRQVGIRDFVQAHNSNSALSEGYNDCLRKLLSFRQLHLHFATTYIAQKVANPVGTGGTIFMDWLSQLVGETEKQLM
jgi:indoleamine 2,3-dioxygenase